MSYNAAEFLERLFRSEAASDHTAGPVAAALLALAPEDLPAEWHFLWDERAAIMEYDGELPRERAEALALAEIRRLMQAARSKPP